MMKRPPARYFQRRVRKGLVETVARLSAALAERLGREPTDEELARTLAMNVIHIQRARGRSGGAK